MKYRVKTINFELKSVIDENNNEVARFFFSRNRVKGYRPYEYSIITRGLMILSNGKRIDLSGYSWYKDVVRDLEILLKETD